MVNRRDGKEEQIRLGLSLPEDVLKSCAVVTAVGRKEVTVEGHEGMIACETDRICVRTGKDRLIIEGCGLVVAYYHREEMKVVGNISGISWEYG